jgi:Antitoxin ParD
MSRLTIDLTDQQHQALKDRAALQGKTVKEYALEKLFASGPDEDQAWPELKSLLEQRIAESRAGAVSSRSFEEIVEKALRADEAE